MADWDESERERKRDVCFDKAEWEGNRLKEIMSFGNKGKIKKTKNL